MRKMLVRFDESWRFYGISSLSYRPATKAVAYGTVGRGFPLREARFCGPPRWIHPPQVRKVRRARLIARLAPLADLPAEADMFLE